MDASTSTVPSSRSSVTPRGTCTKGAARTARCSGPAPPPPPPSRSARPSCRACGQGGARVHGGSTGCRPDSVAPRGGGCGTAAVVSWAVSCNPPQLSPAAHLPLLRAVRVRVAPAVGCHLDGRQQLCQAACQHCKCTTWGRRARESTGQELGGWAGLSAAAAGVNVRLGRRRQRCGLPAGSGSGRPIASRRTVCAGTHPTWRRHAPPQ